MNSFSNLARLPSMTILSYRPLSKAIFRIESRHFRGSKWEWVIAPTAAQLSKFAQESKPGCGYSEMYLNASISNKKYHANAEYYWKNRDSLVSKHKDDENVYVAVIGEQMIFDNSLGAVMDKVRLCGDAYFARIGYEDYTFIKDNVSLGFNNIHDQCEDLVKPHELEWIAQVRIQYVLIIFMIYPCCFFWLYLLSTKFVIRYWYY